MSKKYVGNIKYKTEMQDSIEFPGGSVYIETSTVVVVVVFTLTDRASTIPSNIRGCQSGTWSQRGMYQGQRVTSW